MSTDDISVDSDVAFAFVDFSNVDFGGDEDDKHDSTDNNTSIREQDDEYCDDILIAKKAEAVRKASLLKKTFPGGQDPEEEHEHNPELFQAQCLRVNNLVRWYELGARPSLADENNLAAHAEKDEDLFQSSTDNLRNLLLRSIEAQDEVNKNLPPHPVADSESHLRVATSTIEGAGNGLFTTAFIPKGTVVCHYTGYRHHCKYG
jgi:hypothetical protein